jgi:nitroreductase
METAELIKLIKTRRSIHAFQDEPVPEGLIIEAIETATWAPNGGNAQNWRFLVILDKKVNGVIADAIDGSIKTMQYWPEMANAGPPPNTNLLRSAPALIIMVSVRSPQGKDSAVAKPANVDLTTKQPFGKLQNEMIAKRAGFDPLAKEMFDGLQVVAGNVQSTSAAVAYLMLVLHQMGLGSLWMTGPLHAKAVIERALRLPAGMDIVTLIPVGYPAENPSKTRKPVMDVCQIIK